MGRDYRERYSVYETRPYHAYCLSDEEEDDDVCVWEDGPELSDLYDSDEETATVYAHDPVVSKTTTQIEAEKDKSMTSGRHEKQREAGSSDTNAARSSAGSSGRLTDEQFQERQVAYALSTARRNLTRMSQFILKLECRAGKVTKEGIRRTLDATVNDNRDPFEGRNSSSYLDEIEELKHLSESSFHRLYLIDRHWRRQSRAARDAQGRSPDLQIKSEPEVKSWLKVETRTNHLAGEDTCYFTVADLANGRRFKDWVINLRNTCEFKDHPTDEAKLVELAWRFLDRNLRGPRPVALARIEDFVIELESKQENGGFDEALKDPKRNEQDNEQAWKDMKKYWFSRIPY
ncbi:hypothetical protein AAE478_008132 [Parahypoxylon ruwenzoriense]